MTGVQTCALPICFPVTIGGMQEKFIDIADASLIKSDHAVVALIKHINEEFGKGHKVSVAFIGPLTNMALAI